MENYQHFGKFGNIAYLLNEEQNLFTEIFKISLKSLKIWFALENCLLRPKC